MIRFPLNVIHSHQCLTTRGDDVRHFNRRPSRLALILIATARPCPVAPGRAFRRLHGSAVHATWSVEWYVDQARRHGVHGVPVLELHADNVDDRQYDAERVHRDVGRWLEERVLG